MKLHWLATGLVLAGLTAAAQERQPQGVAQDLQGLASEPATHSAFTFDRDMIQSAVGLFADDTRPVAGLDSITVENYRYHEPVFYIPENVHALAEKYKTAGWTHLVEQQSSPKDSATPHKQLTDLWLHFEGTNIDGVTVVVRGPRQMSVVEVAGILKPIDLLHLSGHFGIPKVDPGAVMVPEGHK